MSRAGRKIWGRLSRGGYGVSVAVIAFTIGGIVLLRASGEAHGATTGSFGSGFSGSDRALVFEGPGLAAQLQLAQDAVHPWGAQQVLAQLRIKASPAGKVARAPVAMAVVLDVSGSMAGEKIQHARSAVSQLVQRMHAEDQVAIITYNHTAQLFLPLSPVSLVRQQLEARLFSLGADGGTNIPAGIELGMSSLNGASWDRVRRVVLVSDGRDGSGRSKDDIARELRVGADRGVAVSSLGIGLDYDEPFLTSVADAGRGNYAFLRGGDELQSFLTRELDQASNTMVDQAVASVQFPRGLRVERVLGAATLPAAPGQLHIPIGSLFAGEERHVTLVLAADPGALAHNGGIQARLTYRTVSDNQAHDVIGSGALAVRVVQDEAAVNASRDLTLHGALSARVLDDAQSTAIASWKAGNGAEARATTQQRLTTLRQLQAAAPSKDVADRIDEMEEDMDAFAMQPEAAAAREYQLRAGASRRERSRR